MTSTRLAYVALSAAAMLFGATFVVVKEAVETLPPFAFVGWRFALGTLALAAIARPRGRRVWRDGGIAGVLLFAGYALQTKGLEFTSASNSGLVTGLYVVFTPLLAAVVVNRRPRPLTLVGTALAFVGLALLTVTADFRLEFGDLLTVGCAVAFAGHIVYLAQVARRHAVLPFTTVQLAVTAVGGLILSLTEGAPIPAGSMWIALVVTGLGVSAGAFLLQIWSQTVIGPSRTAIILALEPVFAAASAAIFLGERLPARGLIGGALILAGIYLVLSMTNASDDLPVAEAITPAH